MLLPILADLDRWFADGVAAAGPGVVLCRAGCSACCLGPFDISPADAEMVAAAVEALDAETRSAVRARAAAQVAKYAEHQPSWKAPFAVDALTEAEFDAICDALHTERCPALGDNGACLIYERRPATCRMTGLAMQTPAGDVLENECPILHTSAAYAALAPVVFDLAQFEDAADAADVEAERRGWIRTTVAGAVEHRARRE